MCRGLCRTSQPGTDASVGLLDLSVPIAWGGAAIGQLIRQRKIFQVIAPLCSNTLQMTPEHTINGGARKYTLTPKESTMVASASTIQSIWV